jgi:hypothetical protein
MFKAFIWFMWALSRLHNQKWANPVPDLVSVLCQGSLEVQDWNIFFAFLVIDGFDLVFFYQSGHFATALLFDGLDDHAYSWDFCLSSDQGDFVVGL